MMRVVRRGKHTPALITNVLVSSLTPDKNNPRKADPARTGLLRLSIAKLGFIQPIFADVKTGLLLSGHQRTSVARELGISTVPVIYVDLPEHHIRGINVLFNRVTNDFNAFDTGKKAQGKLDLETVIESAEALQDFEGEHWFAIDFKMQNITSFVEGEADRYDKKAVNMASSLLMLGVRIPIVVSESGKIVNGIHRAFSALEQEEKMWPVIAALKIIAGLCLKQ